MVTNAEPDYWSLTNKELIAICKKLSISRWSGKRKKDLIAMIKAVEQEPVLPPEPEPYEMLDATLLQFANQVLASLPISPISVD